MMRKKIRFGKKACRMCGRMVTKNALGRASHEKSCHGRAAPTMRLKTPAEVAAERRRNEIEDSLARPVEEGKEWDQRRAELTREQEKR